jgi:penicillin amidase
MNLYRRLFRLLLGRRLPVTMGTVQVDGCHEPVTIRRDRYGIPHIQAHNDEDAWYGLGFCQGQDRSFQLELLIRAGRGTLSALLGPDGLNLDRLSHRIGYYRSAEEQLAFLDESARHALEAYARGVNAGRSIGCRRHAHEFALLRAEPTPYTAADVLAYLKMMSFRLSSNWDNELSRFQILRQDGPEALAALDPTYPEWHPVTAPPGSTAGKAIDRLAKDLACFQAYAPPGGGSNNWAIAGNGRAGVTPRTATGRPILANDPHLSASVPPHWYLAHIRTPEWSVAGASFVGGPAFPAGHNGFAAWGVTAGFVDNTDLFLEEIGPDGCSVRQGDEYIPCERRVEIVEVRGKDRVREVVLTTPRGPIIGPALGDGYGAISLRATWLDPRPARGLLDVHRVRSFEQLRHMLYPWPATSQNVAYADTSGTIGWHLMGDIPVRRKGSGALPLPGWDPEVGWEDEPLPLERTPCLSDPRCGYLATANTRPTPEGQGPFMGVDFIDGYRLACIIEALDARYDWSIDAVMALQLDQVSLPWREMREVVLAVPAITMDTQRALAMLSAWDGALRADSPAAALYEMFVSEMAQRVARAAAPQAGTWALGKGTSPLVRHTLMISQRLGHLVRLLRQQPEGWFSRLDGPGEPWPQEIAAALNAAYRTLRERYGPDPTRWAWGQIRPLVLRHPLGARRPLDRIYNLGPLPLGGDTHTVNQAGVDLTDPAKGVLAIASLRMAIDVGEWENSRFSLPGGQSGNPLSPHYEDLLPFWERGQGVPIAWSEEAVAQAARETLRLEPREGD